MATAEELQKELEAERAKNAENIKALQQKLTEKDKATKDALDMIEELKKKSDQSPETEKRIAELNETVQKLSGNIEDMHKEKRKEELRQKFPEILPELLIGRTDEEIEIIVKKQREQNERIYGRSASAHAPKYEDVSQIDKEIETVKEDKSLTTEEKIARVRELKLEKNNF